MGECVLCEQQITNPLCPERLEEQMKSWLLDSREDLLEKFEKASEELLPCSSGEDVCIVTGRKMSICVYCYTEHIFNWLLKNGPEPELLKEFMVYFNFDEGRRGYWRAAERMDVLP